MKVRTVKRKTMRSQKKAVSRSRRWRAERRWECSIRLGTDIVVVLVVVGEDGHSGDDVLVGGVDEGCCWLCNETTEERRANQSTCGGGPLDVVIATQKYWLITERS